MNYFSPTGNSHAYKSNPIRPPDPMQKTHHGGSVSLQLFLFLRPVLLRISQINRTNRKGAKMQGGKINLKELSHIILEAGLSKV